MKLLLNYVLNISPLSCGLQEGSPRLWAFIVASYWVSFVTYYLVWRAYRHASNLRAEALMSPEVKNEQFAVLARDIPAPTGGQTRKEQVDSYFKAIYPDTYYRSMIVTDNKQVLVSIHLCFFTRSVYRDIVSYHLLISGKQDL